MKRKMMIGILIIAFSMQVGCSNSRVKEEGKVESIVIDEDTKKTINTNSEIKIELVSKIALPRNYINVNGDLNSDIIMQRNPIKVKYYDEYRENVTDRQISYSQELNIGTITSNKDGKDYNIIEWKNKKVEEKILARGANSIRIYKEDKVYTLKDNGEFKEIKAYETLIKEYGEELITSIDNSIWLTEGAGSIDIIYLNNNNDISYLIDGEEDKLYIIDKNEIDGFKDKNLNVLDIVDNKIYVMLTEGEGIGGSSKTDVTIGYIENNNFYEVLSKNKGVAVSYTGYQYTPNNAVFSNNRILFSNFEENPGIWNYNIESGELKKEMDIEQGIRINLFPSKDKKRVIIETYSEGANQSISIGNINENLEISNLTNIVSGKISINGQIFFDWSEDSTEFYLGCKGEEEDKNFFEIYKVIE